MKDAAKVQRWSRRSVKLALATAGFTVAGFSLSARAVDVDWDNSSGNGQWLTPANWSNDQVPETQIDGQPPTALPDADATFVNPAAGPANITATIPRPRDIKFGSDVDGVQRPGAGTVNHTGGEANLVGWFRMGIGGVGTGTYNLSGATSVLEAGRINVAESTGSINTLAVSGGTLRQRDSDNAEPAWNRIGGDGAATFNVSGGTVSFHARTMYGAAGNSVATINQTGGTVETRFGEINIADTGDAIYNISAGTLRKGGTDGDGLVVGQWTGGNGTVNVSGTGSVVSEDLMIVGHGDPGAAADAAVGIVNQTGGTVRLAQATAPADQPDVQGVSLMLGRNVSGNGTYNLSGGVLDLSGGSIAVGLGNGLFNMTGGELRNVSAIEADDDNGPFTHGGGVIAVGPVAGTPGTTTINGNYTQAAANPASLPAVQIDITAAGSDVLDINGTAVLSGTLDLVIAPGTTLVEGQMFTVLTSDGLTGTFSDAVGQFNEDGYAFSASYANNNVVLTVIPEPATAALAALGVAGLLLRRRRLVR